MDDATRPRWGSGQRRPEKEARAAALRQRAIELADRLDQAPDDEAAQRELAAVKRDTLGMYHDLVASVAAAAFRKCRGRLPSGEEHADAMEELVQRLSLEAAKAAQRWDPRRASFGSYVRPSLKWDASHAIHADMGPLPILPELEEKLAEVAEDQPDMDAAEGAELRRRLASLPEPDRGVVERWAAGHGDHEIASATGRTLDDLAELRRRLAAGDLAEHAPRGYDPAAPVPAARKPWERQPRPPAPAGARQPRPPEVRAAALAMLAEGTSAVETARRIGVAESTVYEWRRHAAQGAGSEAAPPTEHQVAAWQREAAAAAREDAMRHERDVREKAVARLEAGERPADVADSMSLPRATVHAWDCTRKRQRKAAERAAPAQEAPAAPPARKRPRRAVVAPPAAEAPAPVALEMSLALDAPEMASLRLSERLEALARGACLPPPIVARLLFLHGLAAVEADPLALVRAAALARGEARPARPRPRRRRPATPAAPAATLNGTTPGRAERPGLATM